MNSRWNMQGGGFALHQIHNKKYLLPLITANRPFGMDDVRETKSQLELNTMIRSYPQDISPKKMLLADRKHAASCTDITGEPCGSMVEKRIAKNEKTRWRGAHATLTGAIVNHLVYSSSSVAISATFP